MIPPITFLAPIAGLIAAGLAIPTLVLLYFLKLRRRPVRVSSTMLWDNAAADLQVNVPFRWIRPSWLLFLQLIGLALLVVAVARPSIESLRFAAPRIVLLVDRSASMGAADAPSPAGAGAEPITRLEAAKLEAKRILSNLPSETEVMLVGFASSGRTQTSFTRDRGLVRRAIDELQQTDEPTDFDAAVELVRAVTQRPEESGPAAGVQVALFSDGGFLSAGSQTPGDLGATLPEGFQFFPAGPGVEAGNGAGSTDNAGIVSLSARRDFEDPALVRLFVRVQSVTPIPIEAGLVCTLNGETVSSRVLTIGAGSLDAPSEASHTFEFANSAGGVATVSLSRSDVLASDNTAAVVLRRPAVTRVLVVRPTAQADEIDALFMDALAALEPTELRAVSLAEYERREGELSRSHELIIFDRVRPPALPPCPSISFGATVPIPGLGVSDPSAGGAPPASTGFAFWQRSHPVMRFVTLTNAWIARPLTVTLPSSTGPEAARVETLASGLAGPLIVIAEVRGVRRIIVGFDLGESTWIRDASFHVFLKNAYEHLTLTGEADAGRSYRTTEPVQVRPAVGATTLEVSGPLTLSREVPPTLAEGESIAVGPFPEVGLYTVRGAVESDSAAAVNLLDPQESTLRTVRSASAAIAAGTAGAETAGPREIWHWFVAAALVLLSIEWLVYAARMRI